MGRVLIVGAGKAGLAIAKEAQDLGWAVEMIERRADHVAEVTDRMGGVRVTHGSGTDMGDLEVAGIRTCDTVVACTGSDEVNLVVATLAKHEFWIPSVMARLVDPRNRWLFGPDLGVDVVLDETRMLVDQVTEHFR